MSTYAEKEKSYYGRDQETWDRLAEAGLRFLIEQARLQRPTTYTELNAALARRTGLPGFDFGQANERAAMGHLLWLIVERNLPVTGFMISALVNYSNANDAGTGFYGLAQELGLLRKDASPEEKKKFRAEQLNGLYEHYSRAGTAPGG